MHVRMQSQENVEISNPMYLREEADEDVESQDQTFALAGNKVFLSHVTLEFRAAGVLIHSSFNDQATNFANPIYESMYSDSAACSSAASEEKKGLLQSESSHPHEQHKDHPLAEQSEAFT